MNIYPGWNTENGGLSDSLHNQVQTQGERAINILLQKLYRKTGAGSVACIAPIRTRQSRLKPLQRAGVALPLCSKRSPGQTRGFSGFKPAAILTRLREDAQAQPAVQACAWQRGLRRKGKAA
ncbi:hypothetical protein [Pantoea sp. AS142]|uniref:hypothetical protein n=1 Tax=Pantoea sp. AS142 TaxID=3081292 RepID=UPI003017C872